MTAYDAVFVGSGINALAGAALLAREGWSVCVLERDERLGGAIRTVPDYTLPGFTHEVFSSWHPLFAGSAAYAQLADDLHARGLEYRNTDLPTATAFPDGEAMFLQTSLEANVAEFDRQQPGDGAAWAAQFEAFMANADLSFGVLGTELWSGAGLSLGRQALRRMGRRGALAFAGSALATCRDWTGETFASPRAHGLLAPWVLHTGLGPDNAVSGFMTQVIACAVQLGGMPVPVGGGVRLVDGLAGIVADAGGSVRAGAHVERVVVRGGRAVGVVLADGEVVHATRAVVAGVTPTQLYGSLLRDGDAPPQARAAAARYRYGRAGMQIHLALDEPPRWAGPDGKWILWIQLQELPAGRVRGDAAGELDVGDGSWTEDLREAYADRICARLGTALTNLEAATLKRIVLSPADIEALDCNLVGGDIYAGSCALDQNLLWRPSGVTPGHRTPVDGLWHIGASTHPGPGLGAGSGYLVAKELTRPSLPKRFLQKLPGRT